MEEHNTWGAVWTYLVIAVIAAGGPSLAWGLNVYTHWEPNVKRNFTIAREANNKNMAKLDSIYSYVKAIKDIDVHDSIKPLIAGLLRTSNGKYRLISVSERKAMDSVSVDTVSTYPLASIENIEVKYIRDISFRVYWTVDRPSKGKIEFGSSSGNYTFETKMENNTLTEHVQTVGGASNPLTPNTEYFFRIFMEDEFGVKAYSQEYSQKTD